MGSAVQRAVTTLATFVVLTRARKLALEGMDGAISPTNTALDGRYLHHPSCRFLKGAFLDSQREVVFGFTFGRGIIGCDSRQLILRRLKLERRILYFGRQPGEFQFSVGVCVGFEIEFADSREAICDVNFDVRS